MRKSRAGQLVRSFLVGLAAVVPIWVTVAMVSWVAKFVEATLGRWVAFAIPDHLYWPGTGVMMGLALITLVGWLLDRGPLRSAFEALERGVEHVPAVRSVYGTVRDLMAYLVDSKTTTRRKQNFSKVAAIKFGGNKARVVGLITREDLTGLSDGINGKDSVMVYLPMSYQLGGYTVIVPRSEIEPVEMTVEDAIRLTMTAGVSSETNHAPNGAAKTEHVAGGKGGAAK